MSFDFNKLSTAQKKAKASYKQCTLVSLHFCGGIDNNNRTRAEWKLFHDLRRYLYSLTKDDVSKSNMLTNEKVNTLLNVNKLPAHYKKGLKDYLTSSC